MGSSSSKAVRKLPTTSTKSATRPTPAWAGARTPHPDHPPPPPHLSSEPVEAESSAGGPLYGSSSSGRPLPQDPSGVAAGGRRSSTQSERPMWHDNSSGANVGSTRGSPGFSGEKDDAIKRDAMDPQFASNLSRLGQVKIEEAGRFFKPSAPAQRTLNARQTQSELLTTSPNALSPTQLITLLDRLKTLPANADVNKVYREFGVDADTMAVIRRWVNSPSVGEKDEVRVVEGEEIREMKAIWVDGRQGQQARLRAPKT